MLKTTPEQRARLRENHRDSAVMRIEHAMDLLDDVETLLAREERCLRLEARAYECSHGKLRFENEYCGQCLDDELTPEEPGEG